MRKLIMRKSRGTAQQCEGECSLLNKESTRSHLNLSEMRGTTYTDLDVQHNNVEESALY